MRALILAAGRGTRLRARHDGPKCLLPVGGVALLDRYIATLDACGVATTVVAGYGAAAVRDRLTALAPRTPCTVVVNEDFARGSIVSLARGLQGVDGALLLLDGDVLFHPALLHRLLDSPHASALLVDAGAPFTGEEYMAGVDGGRVHALCRARVTGHEVTGEWVGFARLDAGAVIRLGAAIDRRIAAGEVAGGYEDALASLLPEVDVRCETTSDLPWIEIDYPDDADRADALVRQGIL